MRKKESNEPFFDELTALRKRNAELENKQSKDMTARKQAEKALQDANERMEFAQRSAKAGIWNWDIKTGHLEWSAELFELFGLDRHHTRPSFEAWESVIHPDDREVAKSRINLAVKNCSSLTNEYRIIREGQIRWINALGQANPVRMSGICIDITDRKHTEDALRDSNERLSILSDLAKELLASDEPQAIIEKLCQKVMVYLNCDVFFNFLVDDEEQRLRLNAFSGISDKSVKEIQWLDFGVAVCGTAARDSCRIVAEHIPTTIDPKTDLIRSFGIKAYACHPLMSHNKVIGTLSFGTRSRLSFSEDDLNMMKVVADQVALAIERKRTFEALYKAREGLEQRVAERTFELRRQAELLDLAHDAIIVRDTKGKIAFWSSGSEGTYGWRKDEAVGRIIHNLLKTKFPIPLKEIMAIVEQKGRWEGELIHAGKDGKKIVALSRWAVQRNEVKGPVQVLEINRDITERKKVEESLRLAGAYNRSLIEASPDPLVTIDAKGKINDVNTATEIVTGLSRNDLIGTDFSNYFTDPKKARTGYKLVFKEGVAHDYELEIRHRDGHITPVIYSASLYKDETGHVKGVFAAARNITKRRKAEEDLVRLAAAVDQSADGIIVTDLGGTILYANSSFLAQTGYSRMELLDQNIEIVRSGKDTEDIYRDMRKRTARGEVWYGEVINRKKDGMLYNAYMTVSPVKDQDGRITNYVSIINDITEKKKFEKQLREAQKMQAIGTLAGGVAHDFNNIIAGIIGFTEMVLEDIPAESPSQRRLQLVLKGAYRGRDLVKQILVFSRRGEHDKEPVSLNHVIQEVSLLLRASMPTTIEIRKNLALKSDIIMADQTQIHQVILNLCSNAAYAMRDKGGILNIELVEDSLSPEDHSMYPESKPGQYVRLTVSDTGCGIKQEDIDHIFEPFFTTKGPGEGTGLGLSVVHGIIKNHDGFLKVYSKPGKGSSFHAFLPKAKGQLLSEKTETDSVTGGKESILFVDDEELLVEMTKQRLERLGYKVVCTTNALKALAIFRAKPDMFNLVITDYTMPQMTGFDLSIKLLRIRPDIPIIMCSGLNDPVPKEKLKKAGIKKIIIKPFGKKEFSQTIRNVLDKHKNKII